MNKLSRIILVVGTFAVLLASRSAYAGWISGYPCVVQYQSRANVGDKMTVNLYSQAYCGGSWVGSVDFYGVNASGQAQACIQPSMSITAATMPALHERILDNYWRSMSIYTEMNPVACGGYNYSAAIYLQMQLN
jgi:hypothetical protein